MPLPSPLPLGDFERAIQADPDVLGVFYFGSLGRGAATRHSDLDILVVVPDHIAEPESVILQLPPRRRFNLSIGASSTGLSLSSLQVE